MLVLVLIIAIAAVFCSIWQFRRTDGLGVDRILGSLIPVSVGALAILLLLRIVQGPSQDWNEAKLAPVFGMTHGYNLYQDPANGVMTGWLYGPVGAIALLPSALAADPTTAVFLGISIAMFFYLGPVAWVIYLASGKRVTALAIAAFLAVAWDSVVTDALSRCLVVAAPDAIAIGLATCACAVIYSSRTTPRLIASAILAALAIWTKQNYLPIVFALTLWVAINNGIRITAVYGFSIICSLVAISALFIAIFGASPMLFHMITLPGSQPWRETQHATLVIWLLGFHDLFATCAVPMALVASVLVVESFDTSNETKGIQAWFRARPWLLFLIVGIFMVPGSLAAYLKVGGYVNSLGCTNFFVLLGAAAGFVEVGCVQTAESIARRLVTTALSIFGLAIAVETLLAGNGIVGSWEALLHPYRNAQYTTFAYGRNHPGEIYCPWNPLTTLFIDDKLYHFEWGIIDRATAKQMVSNEQYLGHFPANMQKVVYFHTPQSTKALDLLVDFHRRVQDPAMPDCIMYTR